MKVIKTNKDVTYLVKNTTHYFEVDGHTIRVYEYVKDGEFDYEYDYEADEDDMEVLSEEQRELFTDELHELITMEVKGETILTNE